MTVDSRRFNTLNDDVKLKSRLDTSFGHKRGYDRQRRRVSGEGDTDHAQPSEESSPVLERAALKRHLAPGVTRGPHASCQKCQKGIKACHCDIYISIISDKEEQKMDSAALVSL